MEISNTYSPILSFLTVFQNRPHFVILGSTAIFLAGYAIWNFFHPKNSDTEEKSKDEHSFRTTVLKILYLKTSNKIVQLERLTGTKIRISKKTVEMFDQPVNFDKLGTLRIAGRQKDIEDAAKRLAKITCELQIKKDLMHKSHPSRIIGKAGRSITLLRRQSGAYIRIDKLPELKYSMDPSRKIFNDVLYIVGTPEEIKNACKDIDNIINNIKLESIAEINNYNNNSASVVVDNPNSRQNSTFSATDSQNNPPLNNSGQNISVSSNNSQLNKTFIDSRQTSLNANASCYSSKNPASNFLTPSSTSEFTSSISPPSSFNTQSPPFNSEPQSSTSRPFSSNAQISNLCSDPQFSTSRPHSSYAKTREIDSGTQYSNAQISAQTQFSGSRLNSFNAQVQSLHSRQNSTSGQISSLSSSYPAMTPKQPISASNTQNLDSHLLASISSPLAIFNKISKKFKLINFDDYTYDNNIEIWITSLTCPSLFFVQPYSLNSEFSQNDYYNSFTKSIFDDNYNNYYNEKYNFEVDEMASAPFSNNSNYLRSIITKIIDDKCEVFSVDYGDVKIIEISQLRAVNERQKELPFLAIPCSLRDIKPMNGMEWSPEAIKCFIDVSNAGVITPSIIKIYNNSYPLIVDLIVTENNKKINVADYLVSKDLATRIRKVISEPTMPQPLKLKRDKKSSKGKKVKISY